MPEPRARRASQKAVLAALVEAGIAPFPRPEERAIASTIDRGPKVVIDLGPEVFQRRLLPSVNRRKSQPVIDDFVEFARGQSKTKWRYWNVRPLSGKIALDKLEVGVRAFGDELGDAVEYMRKRFNVKSFLVTMHIRMDDTFETFDIHAHLILDVGGGDEAGARKYLMRRFAEVDAPRRKVQNVGNAVAYMFNRLYDHPRIPEWPEEARRAAWALSGSRTKLVRAYGAFAEWRRTHKAGRGASDETEKSGKQARRRQDAPQESQKPRPSIVTAFPIKGVLRGLQIDFKVNPSPAPASMLARVDAPERTGAAAIAGSSSSANVSTTPESVAPDTDSFHSSKNRIPFRKVWWWKAWHYEQCSIPAPIRRRALPWERDFDEWLQIKSLGRRPPLRNPAQLRGGRRVSHSGGQD
jgi:hypothetical protein